MINKRPILLIDDNPSDVALAKRAFDKAGLYWPLVVADSGDVAINYLKKSMVEGETGSPPLPSLILLDLKLPGISGHEVLKEIRAMEHTSFLPVIVISTSKEINDVKNAYCNGANSYVRKPVDFLEFTNVIKNIADYWLDINVPVQ